MGDARRRSLFTKWLDYRFRVYAFACAAFLLVFLLADRFPLLRSFACRFLFNACELPALSDLAQRHSQSRHSVKGSHVCTVSSIWINRVLVGMEKPKPYTSVII